MTRAFLCLLLCVGCFTNARAENYEDLYALKPFASKEARKHLEEVSPDLSEEALSTLAATKEIRYSFNTNLEGCPLSPEFCDDGRSYAVVSRQIILDGEQFVASMKEAVSDSSYIQRGCSRKGKSGDRVQFSNTHLRYINRDSVAFRGSVHVENWSCGTIRYRKATGDGSWNYAITLDKKGPDLVRLWPKNSVFRGEMDFNMLFSKRIKKKLFGFINLETTFGKMFDDILLNFEISPVRAVVKTFKSDTPKEALDRIMREVLAEIAGTEKMLESTYVSSLDAYHKALKKMDRPDYYYLDPIKTGFIRPAPGTFDILFKEDLYIPKTAADQYYQAKCVTIEIIKSYSDGVKTYVVKKNESLWKIAKEHYCDGESYIFLAKANPEIENLDYIHEGIEIKIPPRWKLELYHKQGKLVFPGDSIWDLYEKKGTTSKWDPENIPLPRPSTDPNLIYPYQVIAVP